MKALKQNDYHYWDGYFKGLGVKELLEMLDSYWELLTSDFIKIKSQKNTWSQPSI